MFEQCRIHRIHFTCIFLPSRDFFQEKQSYVLTESPLSMYEGGANPFHPSILQICKVEMNFNTF
jgi:hypothetical protein